VVAHLARAEAGVVERAVAARAAAVAGLLAEGRGCGTCLRAGRQEGVVNKSWWYLARLLPCTSRRA
jgi:hypothetical protein